MWWFAIEMLAVSLSLGHWGSDETSTFQWRSGCEATFVYR